jgi:hypothetical protein
VFSRAVHLTKPVLLLPRNRSARLLRWMACLCLLLMVFAAVAEARHFHNSAHGDSQRCSVCLVAHSPTLQARATAVAPQRVSTPLVAVHHEAFFRALALDSHSIRPPPASESV